MLFTSRWCFLNIYISSESTSKVSTSKISTPKIAATKIVPGRGAKVSSANLCRDQIAATDLRRDNVTSSIEAIAVVAIAVVAIAVVAVVVHHAVCEEVSCNQSYSSTYLRSKKKGDVRYMKCNTVGTREPGHSVDSLSHLLLFGSYHLPTALLRFCLFFLYPHFEGSK